MMDFCNYLINESEIVKDKIVECWINDLDEFVQRKTRGEKKLPLDDAIEFYTYLFKFIETDVKGIAYFRSLRVGFFPTEPTEEYPFDRKLAYSVIAALSIGDSRDPRELKLPIYLAWEEDIKKLSENAPEGMKIVY